MSLADRVREFLKMSKPGYGRVDTEQSLAIKNRHEARRYLRAKGPWQHFTATPDEQRTRKPGRSRAKRNTQRVQKVLP